MAYEGINRLGRVIQSRMGEMNQTGNLIDFATIRGDMSLELDECDDIIIPRDEYNVLQTCKQNHSCPYGGCELELRSGDRVVIAWVGSDVVVLGKLGE